MFHNTILQHREAGWSNELAAAGISSAHAAIHVTKTHGYLHVYYLQAAFYHNLKYHQNDKSMQGDVLGLTELLGVFITDEEAV